MAIAHWAARTTRSEPPPHPALVFSVRGVEASALLGREHGADVGTRRIENRT